MRAEERATLVVPCVLAYLLSWLDACARPAQSGEVIERYRAAACLAPLSEPKRIQPLTREWDHVVMLRDGSKVTVVAYQAVGGRVDVRYTEPEADEVAASSGDYVYPADIRLDSEHDVLYVKNSGLAGGLWNETWLFGYDLVGRRQLVRLRVDPRVLPPECPRATQGDALAK